MNEQREITTESTFPTYAAVYMDEAAVQVWWLGLRSDDELNPLGYTRYRANFYTDRYRPLLAGVERELEKVVAVAVSQFGGRLVAIEFLPYRMLVDYIAPAHHDINNTNNVIRRQTSDYFKNNHKGVGSSDKSHNSLWRKNVPTYRFSHPCLYRKGEVVEL